MLAVSVFPVERAWHGGWRMSSPPPAHEVPVTPVQVWPALSLDLRTRVIGLLAQLVLNMVTRLANEGEGSDGADAESTIVAKNPS